MRRSENKGDFLLLLSIGALGLSCVNYAVGLPFQAFVILYGLLKCDVRYMPAMYIAMMVGGNFAFTGQELIRFVFIIPLSPLNIFTVTCFLYVLCQICLRRFDRGAMLFVPLWLSAAIPALAIAMADRADNVSSWPDVLVKFMVPAFYYWGILAGRTWENGREYFVKRFMLIFCVQVSLEIMRQYNIGCQFQDSIVPICLGIAIIRTGHSVLWKGIALLGMALAFALMLFAGYLARIDLEGSAEDVAVVSTFTRMFVVVIGVILALAIGKSMRRSSLRMFPWLCLIVCSTVFFYAVVRADYKNVGDEVIKGSEIETLMERFEFKLIGDRGALWLKSMKEELFKEPLVFKKSSSLLRQNPETGEFVLRVPPHNQVLTLLCRQGWWFGLVMVIFLWWMHLRSFKAACWIDRDVQTLVVLLAPSAAIFVAVGLTGQHVFSQVWIATSMASLTFPGIIYGAAESQYAVWGNI